MAHPQNMEGLNIWTVTTDILNNQWWTEDKRLPSCFGELNSIKEIGLGVDAEIIKHRFMSHNQTTGQNHYTKAAYKSYENVAKLKYLELMLTNKNCIYKEIKTKKCLVQNLSSCPLHKNND